MPVSRREFLKATAAGLTAGVLAAPVVGNEPTPQKVDTHTHFYDPTRPQGVPWPSQDDPVLYRRFLPEDYRQIAVPHGITGTVVVEASPWVEDNQWILDLAARDPFVLGLVGNLRPGTEDFAKHFPRFAQNPRFVGIRVGSDALVRGLEQPEYVTDLQRLAGAGRELDVNGPPGLLELIPKLSASAPELRVVINHLANVRIDGDKLPEDWTRQLRTAAKSPNVFLKVSALVEGAAQGGRKAPGDPAYYEPVLKFVWDVFGEDRVIYGSNWPVSARFAPYDVVQRIVETYAATRGPAASEKFFWRNALAAYRWPAKPSNPGQTQN